MIDQLIMMLAAAAIEKSPQNNGSIKAVELRPTQ